MFRASQASTDQILTLNSIASVYAVDVISNGAAANYLIRLCNFDDSRVARARGGIYLNPSGEVFQRVTSYASNGSFLPSLNNIF